MKRAEALRPLSREHLAALSVARDLRRATEPAAAARGFAEFWREDGRHHFRAEEEVLLPTWALHAEVDRVGVERMLAEHLAIRREALWLEQGEVDLARLHGLGELLHDHVRFEERTLFPRVEADLDEAALGRLADELERFAD